MSSNNRLHREPLSKCKRRIRIEGKLDELVGYQLKIIDIETGKEIDNITKAVIVLLPGECNTVKFTYIQEHDRMQGERFARYTEEEVIINSPDLSFTANELEPTPVDLQDASARAYAKLHAELDRIIRWQEEEEEE